MGSIVACRRIGEDVLITHAEFIRYFEAATRDEYWIDCLVYEVRADLYIKAGRFLYCYSTCEFYITNAAIELLGSADTPILKCCSADFPADPLFPRSDGEIRFLADEHTFKPLIKITDDEFYVIDEVRGSKKIAYP